MHRPFHEWLQAAILESGHSGPAALATAMTTAQPDAPVDRRTVWRWASGQRLPARAAWPVLAEVLEVPLEELALRVVGVEPMGAPDRSAE